MVTGLLTEVEIKSFLKNSVLHSYAFDTMFSNEVKVMISISDFEKAKEIVDKYCRNLKN